MKNKIGNVNKSLFEGLNNHINKYVEIFSDKHDLVFNGWVADIIGYMALFDSQYAIDFDSIRFDLETGVYEGAFQEWNSLYSKGETECDYIPFIQKKTGANQLTFHAEILKLK